MVPKRPARMVGRSSIEAPPIASISPLAGNANRISDELKGCACCAAGEPIPGQPCLVCRGLSQVMVTLPARMASPTMRMFYGSCARLTVIRNSLPSRNWNTDRPLSRRVSPAFIPFGRSVDNTPSYLMSTLAVSPIESKLVIT